MARIYEDQYGLYIKSGGYIARPVPTEYTRHVPNIAVDSEYCVGDKVKARHVGGCGFHRVGSEFVELWSSHGAYMVPDWENDTVRTLNSEECWEPAE